MARYDPYGTSSVVYDLGNGDISLERVPKQAGITTKSSTIHTVKDGETIQGIAFQYYGDSGKWVDIADLNSLYFPFRDLKVGMKLLIS